MAYVMLGRSQRLEDIQIVEKECKFDPAAIRVCPDALNESNRIQELFEANKAKEAFLWTNHFTISYLNVRRLKPNLRHVKADHMLMKSDAIALAETWLHETDVVQLDGYQEFLLNGGDGKGLATYIKKEINQNWQSLKNDKTSAVFMQLENLDVIYLYLSQGFDFAELKKQLDKWIGYDRMMTIMGDVNIDYLGSDHPFKKYMKKKGFKQLMENPTHELGSLLDHIYVNKKLSRAKPIVTQRSVYFSDHDVIVLHIPEKYM